MFPINKTPFPQGAFEGTFKRINPEPKESEKQQPISSSSLSTQEVSCSRHPSNSACQVPSKIRKIVPLQICAVQSKPKEKKPPHQRFLAFASHSPLQAPTSPHSEKGNVNSSPFKPRSGRTIPGKASTFSFKGPVSLLPPLQLPAGTLRSSVLLERSSVE